MRVRIALLSVLLLMSTACGSANLGGLGDLGEILGSTGSQDSSDVRGVVRSVDTRNSMINLDVSYVNNLRQEESGRAIYYDSNTVVEFQNQTYRVTDLENGDEIEIRGANRDGRFIAERISVLRDATR